MTNLILATGWGKVILIVGGFIVLVIILGNVYSTIAEKTKMDEEKAGCGWPLFLIVIAIIVGLLMNMKSCNCKGNHYNDYDSEEEYWENTPRHT